MTTCMLFHHPLSNCCHGETLENTNLTCKDEFYCLSGWGFLYLGDVLKESNAVTNGRTSYAVI
jgi:hypothetical protein